MTGLSEEQKKRYGEQLALPGMNEGAQRRLLQGSVVILGASGSGAVAAQYLAESGLGNIRIVDEDLKVLSSLRKFVQSCIGTTEEVGIDLKAMRFDARHAEEVLAGAGAVVDALPNWQDKLLASDVCMQLGLPLIHAGGMGFRFQIYTMLPGKSACLRCVFPAAGIDDFPLTPPRAGQLPAVAGMAGAMQAIEAIKIIARLGVTQGNELSKFDCLSGEFEIIRGLDPKEDCPDCGRARG